MSRIYGLPPVVESSSRVLVLGSMPGTKSLEVAQYYGKPQNAFWRIMGELFGAGPELAYSQRLATLNRCGIGLWDTVASCVRPGSLDSAIRMRDLEVNDFPALFARYPQIQHVFFNGKKAEKIFQHSVIPLLEEKRAALVYHSLPSTSPAMAALDFAGKLAHWTELQQVVNATQEPAR